MKCLVLGGGGFLGSHLCDGLVNLGHSVRVFEKKGRSKKNIAHLFNEIEYVEGDFCDVNTVHGALSGVDTVFHLIGTTIPASSNKDVFYDLSTNLIPTIRFLKACKDNGIKKIIFASSGGTVYGIPKDIPISEDHPTDPICSYGIHKLAIEKYLHLFYHLFDIDYKILRISNPYGERQATDNMSQGVVSVFIHKALKNEPIEVWGDGKVVRDYIYVADVVNAFLAVLNYEGEEHIFNVGSGKGHTILDVISELEQLLGYSLDVRFFDSRKVDVPINILSIQKAVNELKWFPTIPFSNGSSLLLASILGA